jgi:hypothetical protein
MHKYVGVYVLLLMYNSSSMCYVGNIVEKLKNYTHTHTHTQFLNNFFCNEMDENYLYMY